MLCVLQYILAWIHYYFHHYIVTIKFLSKHVFVSYFTFTIKGGIANIYETFKNIKFLFVVILFSVFFAMFSNITHLMQYKFTSFFFFSFNTLRTIFSSNLLHLVYSLIIATIIWNLYKLTWPTRDRLPTSFEFKQIS